MQRDLTCREMVQLVTEYLEGALSADDADRFEAHLAGCPHCADYVEQFRANVSLVRRLRDDDVPQPVMDGLLDAFRTWRA